MPVCNGKYAVTRRKEMLRCLRADSSLELVVIGMFVAPIPVGSLLAAPGPAEGRIILGMISPEGLVGPRFAVIPVMIVTVVAIVDSYTNLRCGVDSNRRGSKKCGG